MKDNCKNNNFGVQGFVDVLLIDKATNRVVKHVRKQNHLTEPFARWLMAGNLGVYNNSVRFGHQIDDPTPSHAISGQPASEDNRARNIIVNPISAMLGSHSKTATDVTGVTQTNGHQAIRCSCGTFASKESRATYGVFLLSVPCRVDATTQIPPYFNNTLSGVDNMVTRAMIFPNWGEPYNVGKLGSNRNLAVVQMSGHDRSEDRARFMQLSWGECKWSNLNGNPSYTFGYMKSEGVAEIYSMVLGVYPGEYGSSRSNAYLNTSFSQTFANKTWDSAWPSVGGGTSGTSYSEGAPKSSGYTTSDMPGAPRRLRPNTSIGTYLLAPFVRTRQRFANFSAGTVWGDAMYAPVPSVSFNQDTGVASLPPSKMAYYDYGKPAVVGGPTATETEMLNDLVSPNQLFNANSVTNINATVRGGMVLGHGVVAGNDEGGTRAIKLAIATLSNAGGAGSRTVSIAVQPQIHGTVSTSHNAVVGVVTCPFEIPAAFSNCQPVMVARRGETADEDTVEIFISMGIGDYEETSKEPGGFGIGVYKLKINVASYLKSAMYSNLAAHVSPPVRVAVLPYAIGQMPFSSSSNVTDPNAYCTGSLIGNEYYLPFTHVLEDTSPLTWKCPTKTKNVKQCASSDYQPGFVFDQYQLTRLRDHLFGVEDERRYMMVTSDGLLPMVVNKSHRWSSYVGNVISGVSFEDDPIIKEEEQILIVRYTYSFDVFPNTPLAPEIEMLPAPAPTFGSLTFDIRQPEHPCGEEAIPIRYQLQRIEFGDPDGFDSDSVKEISIPLQDANSNPISVTSYVDRGLMPETRYAYRMRMITHIGSSSWSYIIDGATIEITSSDIVQPPETRPGAIEDGFTVYWNTVTLLWKWEDEVMTPYFSHYSIEYGIGEGPETIVDWETVTDADNVLTDIRAQSFTLRGLDANENYVARIRAHVKDGLFPPSLSANAVSEPLDIVFRTGDELLVSKLENLTLDRITYSLVAFDNEPAVNGTWEFSYDKQTGVNMQSEYIPDGEEEAVLISEDSDPLISTPTKGAINTRTVPVFIPYDKWRNSQIRVVPFIPVSYPVEQSVIDGNEGVLDSLFYNFYHDLSTLDVFTYIGVDGRAWSNKDNLWQNWSPATNFFAPFSNIPGASASVRIHTAASLTYSWHEDFPQMYGSDSKIAYIYRFGNRLSGTGNRKQYEVSHWCPRFKLAYGPPPGLVSPASIEADVKVELYGITYGSANTIDTGQTSNGSSYLLDTLPPLSFASNSVVYGTEHEMELRTIDSTYSGIEFHGFELRITLHKNNAAFPVPNLVSGSDDWMFLDLDLFGIHLFSSDPDVENLS